MPPRKKPSHSVSPSPLNPKAKSRRSSSPQPTHPKTAIAGVKALFLTRWQGKPITEQEWVDSEDPRPEFVEALLEWRKERDRVEGTMVATEGTAGRMEVEEEECKDRGKRAGLKEGNGGGKVVVAGEEVKEEAVVVAGAGVSKQGKDNNQGPINAGIPQSISSKEMPNPLPNDQVKKQTSPFPSPQPIPSIQKQLLIQKITIKQQPKQQPDTQHYPSPNLPQPQAPIPFSSQHLIPLLIPPYPKSPPYLPAQPFSQTLQPQDFLALKAGRKGMQVLVRWKLTARGLPKDSFVPTEEIMRRFPEMYGRWCREEIKRRRKDRK